MSQPRAFETGKIYHVHESLEDKETNRLITVANEFKPDILADAQSVSTKTKSYTGSNYIGICRPVN